MSSTDALVQRQVDHAVSTGWFHREWPLGMRHTQTGCVSHSGTCIRVTPRTRRQCMCQEPGWRACLFLWLTVTPRDEAEVRSVTIGTF